MNKSLMQNKIAIIGMACEVGTCKNYNEFWKALKKGESLICDFPDSRREEITRIFGENINLNPIQSSFIDQVLVFEPEIFSISEDESRYIDPQQRLLLKLTEHAFEDAGYDASRLSDRNIGVYTVNSRNVYGDVIKSDSPLQKVNGLEGVNAARIAYTFHLTGPVVNLDTACSSGCTAVHYACRDILMGDITTAVIAGAVLNLFPMKNEDDRLDENVRTHTVKTRAFDNDADGFVPGEGGVVLLLKDYQQALCDHDHIHALIVGSAVNSNGRRSNGIAAPSDLAQAEVIKKAVRNSGVEPESISYIETHGTATKVGDPIEISGIEAAFQGTHVPYQSIGIGSVKTNIGHTGNAAGLFGILKTALMLEQKEYVESLYFEFPNPHIRFEKTPVYVCTENRAWDTDGVFPRRAGVSSLGMTGTNGHIILEEMSAKPGRTIEHSKQIFVFSSRTQVSLEHNLKNMILYLREHTGNVNMADIAYTWNTGRRNLPYKLIVTAEEPEELLAQLEHALSHPEKIVFHGEKRAPKNLFVFADRICFPDVSIRGKCGDTNDYIASMKKWIGKLQNCSVLADGISGIGSGKAIADYYEDKCSLDELPQAVKNAGILTYEALLDNARWKRLCEKAACAEYDHMFLIGADHKVYEAAGDAAVKCGFKGCWLINDESDFADMAAELLKVGHTVDWEQYEPLQEAYRIPLPVYEYDSRFLTAQIKAGVHSSKDDLITATKAGLDDSRPVGETLGKMLRSVLDHEFDCADAVYDIGINSYEILQFMAKVKNTYGIDIRMESFYEGHTIEELFGMIEQEIQRKREPCKFTESNCMLPCKSHEYPANVYQKRMFMMEQMFPDSLAYNSPFLFKADLVLDQNKLTSCVRVLQNRHTALKTVYRVKGNELFQIILEEPVADISFEPFEAYHSQEEFVREKLMPFDLVKGPVFRLAVAQAADYALIFLDVHHICSDGASFSVMIPELMKLYLDLPLGKQPAQYYEYTQWQNAYFKTLEFKKKEAYWRGLFQNQYLQFNLPADHERKEIHDLSGGVAYFDIDGDRFCKIQEVKKKYGLSDLMFYLGAMGLLVSRYSGQEDIVIGTTVTGRSNQNFAHTVGLFRNTLPIRLCAGEKLRCSDYLLHVRECVLHAYENQDYPFEKLLEHYYKDYNRLRNPIVDVIMVMQNAESEEKENLAEIGITPQQIFQGSTRFDMTVHLYPKDHSLHVKLKYFKCLFEQETILSFIEYFKRTIELLVMDGPAGIAQLDISERGNRSIVSGKTVKHNEELSLMQMFHRSALKYADKTAVITRKNEITYAQLRERVRKLASSIRKYTGSAVQKRIGLLVTEETFVESVLSVWSLNHVFVPIDPELDGDAIRSVIDECGISGLLYQNEALSSIRDRNVLMNESEFCICLDYPVPDDEEAVEAVMSHPEDMAYIIYTSGTSDLRKGVPVKHSSLYNYISWVSREYDLKEDDHSAVLSPLHFDLSFTALFSSVLFGRTVYLPERKVYLDVELLLEQISKYRIRFLKLTPSLLALLLRQRNRKEKISADCVRLVMSGGENINPADMREAKQLFPNAVFVNHYGPAEAAIGSSAKQLDTGHMEMDNIGHPIYNTTIAIVDGSGNIVNRGMMGEIAVCGPGVMDDYIGGLHRAAFLMIGDSLQSDRFYLTGDLGVMDHNLDIHIKGRKDRLVKVHGYQINPESIDRIILEDERIVYSFTSVRQDEWGGRQIVTVIKRKQGYENVNVKQELRKKHPAYLIPDIIIDTDQVTLDNSTKADCRRRPKAFLRTEKESGEQILQSLKKLWSDLLGIPFIGGGEDFFELGGKSIEAVRLCQKINEIFEINMKVYDVFLYRNIKSQAKWIGLLLEHQ